MGKLAYTRLSNMLLDLLSIVYNFINNGIEQVFMFLIVERHNISNLNVMDPNKRPPVGSTQYSYRAMFLKIHII